MVIARFGIWEETEMKVQPKVSLSLSGCSVMLQQVFFFFTFHFFLIFLRCRVFAAAGISSSIEFEFLSVFAAAGISNSMEFEFPPFNKLSQSEDRKWVSSWSKKKNTFSFFKILNVGISDICHPITLWQQLLVWTMCSMKCGI